MFGVPLEGAARVFCDNEAVYNSSSFPESVLKRKHNSVAYHKVRSEVANGTIVVYKEDSDTNLADLLTKVSHSDERRKFLRSRIMYDIKINFTSEEGTKIEGE